MAKRVGALIIGVVGGLAIGSLPSIAFGQGASRDCGAPRPDWLRNPGPGLVFRGTVTDSRPQPNGLVATFRVERVWGGDVRRQVVIHQVIDPVVLAVPLYGNEMPFENGIEYLVSARLPPEGWRTSADGVVWGSANGCGTGATSLERVQTIMGTALGEPPR